MLKTSDLRGFFTTMLRIRYFEEEVARLHAAGDIVGSVHLCNGQEAIYAGACAALDLRRDAVFPTYRGHGWSLACGARLTRCSPSCWAGPLASTGAGAARPT